MKTNFLNLVAKMPQNTGGGNSQTKRATLAQPLRYLCAMLFALVLGVGQMWGANGDVLFSQDFNSATAVSQNLGAAAVDIDKESGNNIFGVTYTNSQFTSLSAAKISNAKGGIAINSKVTSNSVEYDYAKKFGFRSDDTKASFHLVKTTNFASSAPTALKVEMNMYYKQLSSGSNVTASFAIGDGFSDKEKPANSNIHSGFTIKGNGTATFCQFGTTTNLTGYSTAMTQDEDVKMTWVINHSGGVLKYTDPKGDESSLANNAFDVWIGTTKNVSGAPATTNTKALQNLYIGDCGAKKKFEFILDDIKVTDLTPCAAPSITSQPSNASLAIGDANPTLSVTANNTTSYTWKESSDGTSHDGSSSLGTSKDFTPSVNTAAQTKYYYCELVNSCNTSNVVKTNIVTVNVVASVVNVTGVSLDKTSQEFTLGATTTTTLTATVAPNDATNKAVSWESSAPTKVSVTDNGDGTAAIEALAEGTATITVTTQDGSFAATCDVTVNPDPCHKYFWFSKAADATTAGVTNNEGSFFTTSASGSNSASSSITIDEVEYAITNRTSNIGSSDATIVSFTIPADKAGTFYTNMSSSGNSGAASSRTLYLKKGGVTVVTATDAIYGDGAQHNATIENIPSGTYTLHANNNVKVGMFAVKACDATYHTITLDLDGGTGATSIAALDGVPAIKPADPTKEHADFVKWIVKLTEADYNWSANVTGDLTLKAVWSNWPTLTLAAGEGATGDPIANKYKAGTEITVPEKPEGFSKGTDVFTGWAYSQTVTVTDGKFDMPSTDLTLTAQWQAPSDFDVKFYQGYGDPDAQIGETQSISTGGHAVAPTDPERAGFAFLGWSYDATEAHIVDVAEYGITAATNFTAMWKAVWTVTFDGAGAVNVENGEPVASPDSPTLAGKIFQGWYNGESKYDFSAAVTGNLALTSKWADADPNHYVYAYNDDFHFDGVVYKTPEGKTTDPDASEATLDLTTPYTLFSGAKGITSIVATKAVYDYKKADNTKHITAYLKLKKSSEDANSKLIFTIASGYTAVLKVKMGGYSKTPTVTLKKGDDAVTGTPAAVSGKAEDKDYAEITYNLVAGVYEMTTADQTLYFSHIDLQATALPTYTVTYKPGEGTGDDVEDADATNVADVPSTFTAPTGKVFNGWKDESDNDVEVGTIVSSDMTLTAQWINVYAVTFNMNGHGDAIDPQDIKHGAKATRPDDPVAIGFDFGGWFTDNGTFEAPFDFNTPITAATPLFAKWTADPCPDKKSVVKVVMTSTSTATVTGYNDNEYAGGYIINNLADGDNAFAYDFGEGSVTGYKLKGSGSAIFATLAKGGFEAGDKVVFAVTKKAGDNKLAVYAAKDKNNVLKLAEIDVVDAGIYEYKLKAADIAAIEAAGADYKSIGSYRGDYNPFIYSVELKGCRSWAVMHTLTFKNIDGTATIAAEPLEEGAYASTVAPAAPKIALKRFKGWSESIGGTTVDLTSYTITEDKTLYAVYEDIVCPTTGTVYKFEIKDELPSENLPTSTDKDMSSYITATGDGYLTYTATANNKATINSDGTIQMKDASAAYLKVELECALAAGDQIRAHVTNNPIRVQVGTTYDSNKDLILAKNAYEFVAITSAMEGKQVLYITRSSNGNANLADFEIYRPAKYDVSFNMMGHGSAIADLEDVVEGSKITAPTAPTDEDYSFAGWYKENTLENEWKFDVDVVEANTTLYAKWLDKSDATLKSLKYGSTEIELQAGVYTYNVSLPAFTSAVPALTAETSNPNATKVIANAAAFDSEGNATSTVTVTPEVGADQVYYVNFAKGVEILLQDVTGSITWNFANAVTGTVNITGTPQVLANYGGVTNDNTFESDKLEASGEKFSAGTKANLRANYIHFRTTVPGILSISYSNTGGKPARYIYVNGAKYDEDGSANTTPKGADNKVFVPAGDVELVMKDGEDASNNVQIYQMIFNATPGYTRPVTAGRFGTICLPNGGVMVGAELYEVAYKDPSLNKIFFDQIVSGEMIAGRPYIFLPKEGTSQLAVFYTDATDATAGNYHGLYGFIGASSTDEFTIPQNSGNYIIQNNQYREVQDGVAKIVSNRAYLKLNEIPGTVIAPLPGRKRMSIGAAAPQVVTGIDELNASEAPRKVLINGQLFILRGEKMYDAKGQLVK